MATQVGDNQTIDVTASPVDASGAARAVEAGTVSWASSDPAIADIVADPTDELKATITPVAGASGTVDISVTGDADLGGGVATITGSGQLEVILGEATGFTLAFGNPAPKP